VGEKLEKRDIESLLSVMQFNNNHLPIKEVGRCIYEYFNKKILINKFKVRTISSFLKDANKD